MITEEMIRKAKINKLTKQLNAQLEKVKKAKAHLKTEEEKFLSIKQKLNEQFNNK